MVLHTNGLWIFLKLLIVYNILTYCLLCVPPISNLLTYPLHPNVGHKATFVFCIVVSVTVSFHGIESLLLRPTPNLEDQGTGC